MRLLVVLLLVAATAASDSACCCHCSSDFCLPGTTSPQDCQSQCDEACESSGSPTSFTPGVACVGANHCPVAGSCCCSGCGQQSLISECTFKQDFDADDPDIECINDICDGSSCSGEGVFTANATCKESCDSCSSTAECPLFSPLINCTSLAIIGTCQDGRCKQGNNLGSCEATQCDDSDTNGVECQCTCACSNTLGDSPEIADCVEPTPPPPTDVCPTDSECGAAGGYCTAYNETCQRGFKANAHMCAALVGNSLGVEDNDCMCCIPCSSHMCPLAYDQNCTNAELTFACVNNWCVIDGVASSAACWSDNDCACMCFESLSGGGADVDCACKPRPGTHEPSPEPTAEPSAEPSAEPTAEPSAEPTAEPSAEPSPPPPTMEPTPEHTGACCCRECAGAGPLFFCGDEFTNSTCFTECLSAGCTPQFVQFGFCDDIEPTCIATPEPTPAPSPDVCPTHGKCDTLGGECVRFDEACPIGTRREPGLCEPTSDYGLESHDCGCCIPCSAFVCPSAYNSPCLNGSFTCHSELMRCVVNDVVTSAGCYAPNDCACLCFATDVNAASDDCECKIPRMTPEPTPQPSEPPVPAPTDEHTGACCCRECASEGPAFFCDDGFTNATCVTACQSAGCTPNFVEFGFCDDIDPSCIATAEPTPAPSPDVCPTEGKCELIGGECRLHSEGCPLGTRKEYDLCSPSTTDNGLEDHDCVCCVPCQAFVCPDAFDAPCQQPASNGTCDMASMRCVVDNVTTSAGCYVDNDCACLCRGSETSDDCECKIPRMTPAPTFEPTPEPPFEDLGGCCCLDCPGIGATCEDDLTMLECAEKCSGCDGEIFDGGETCETFGDRCSNATAEPTPTPPTPAPTRTFCPTEGKCEVVGGECVRANESCPLGSRREYDLCSPSDDYSYGESNDCVCCIPCEAFVCPNAFAAPCQSPATSATCNMTTMQCEVDGEVTTAGCYVDNDCACLCRGSSTSDDCECKIPRMTAPPTSTTSASPTSAPTATTTSVPPTSTTSASPTSAPTATTTSAPPPTPTSESLVDCCYQNSDESLCEAKSESECEQLGGSPGTLGVDCAFTCGSCCLGCECSELFIFQCTDRGGTFFADSLCTDLGDCECEPQSSATPLPAYLIEYARELCAECGGDATTCDRSSARCTEELGCCDYLFNAVE